MRIMFNSYYFDVFPSVTTEIEMFLDELLEFFCHYVRTSVVNCVLNVLLRANDIDAVVCTTSRVDQYFASTTRNRASKIARVGCACIKSIWRLEKFKVTIGQ